MTRKNILNISLVCAFVSAILFSMVGFSNSCEEMYDNIIRIRILANSDSKEDQQLKLAIRDAVLNKSKEMFSEANSYDDVVMITKANTEKLIEIAEDTVKEKGYSYSVKLSFRDEFFDTREYDDFTLPAGIYKTAVFTVGEGKGKNWWCVIFPQVCVGACSGSLNDAVSDASADYAYNSKSYTVKFKTVEIFEKIKKYLNL